MPVSWFTTLSGGAGGGGFGANRATAPLAAGATNNLNPGGGWPANFGRLVLTAGAGAANLTGLLAGLDNQGLLILNNDPANNITLNSLNAGSAAANQFRFFADLVLTPGDSVVALYDLTLQKWLLT